MENKFDIEDLSLPEIELIRVRAKINSFNSITDVCVHHKTQFIKDFSQHFGKLGESGLVGKGIAIRTKRSPVQSPLDAQLNLGTQPHYEVPSDLWV